MKDMLLTFLAATSDISEDKSAHLLALWRTLVSTYFQYQSSYRHTTQSSNQHLNPTQSTAPSQPPTQGRRRPLGFSLEQARQRGGIITTEQTPHGISTFVTLDNHKYYMSKRGDLWDTSLPPPGACFECGQLHWHWECQK